MDNCNFRINLLENTIVKLEERVSAQSKTIDFMQKDQKKKNLFFHGFKETKNEDCKKLVVEFFKM